MSLGSEVGASSQSMANLCLAEEEDNLGILPTPNQISKQSNDYQVSKQVAAKNQQTDQRSLKYKQRQAQKRAQNNLQFCGVVSYCAGGAGNSGSLNNDSQGSSINLHSSGIVSRNSLNLNLPQANATISMNQSSNFLNQNEEQNSNSDPKLLSISGMGERSVSFGANNHTSIQFQQQAPPQNEMTSILQPDSYLDENVNISGPNQMTPALGLHHRGQSSEQQYI